MDNNFFVNDAHLSTTALQKKSELEKNPVSRINLMEYLPDMEKISSDVPEKVLVQINSFDYEKYSTSDVAAALEHENCTIEDFKALLSLTAEPFLEQMAVRAREETSKHFGNTIYIFTPLYISNLFSHDCGADYVTIFQETYDVVRYEQLHLAGHKRIFPCRFNAHFAKMHLPPPCMFIICKKNILKRNFLYRVQTFYVHIEFFCHSSV